VGYAYLLGVAWVAGGLYAGSHLYPPALNRSSTLALVALPGFARAGSVGLAASPLQGEEGEGAVSPLDPPGGDRGSIVSPRALRRALANPLLDWEGG